MRTRVRRGTARRRIVQGAVVLALVGQAVVTASNVPVSAAAAPIAAGSTERDSVSQGFSLNELPDDTTSYDLSADGRYVVFATTSHADRTCSFTPQLTCVDDRDTNDVSDVFVRDRFTSRTDLITIGPVAVSGVLRCEGLFGSTSLTFPDTGVGRTSAAQDVTCTNDGPGPVTVTNTSINSVDFGVGSLCTGATLLAGDSCQIQATFEPTSSGAKTGTIDIHHTGSNATPISISLSGTAYDIASLSCVTPTTDSQVPAGDAADSSDNQYDFGFVLVDGAPINVVVTCTAGGPSGARVAIEGISLSGNLRFPAGGDNDGFDTGTEPCFGVTLTVGGTASCTSNVNFATTNSSGVDFFKATLSIDHDGSNGPTDQTFFEATGVVPGPKIRGSSARLTPFGTRAFWSAMRCDTCYRISGKVSRSAEPTYTPGRFFGPLGASLPTEPAQVGPGDVVAAATCTPNANFDCLAVGGDHPSISNDGRYIAFDSSSTAYEDSNSDGTTNVYIADRGAPAADGSFPTTATGGQVPNINRVSFFYNESNAYDEDLGFDSRQPSISNDGKQR